jgi:hypothetical protein
MASANGFSLEVKTSFGEIFTLNASWAAPYFSLINDCWNEGDRPILYHAETLEDARRFGGLILNSDFTEYQPNQQREAA